MPSVQDCLSPSAQYNVQCDRAPRDLSAQSPKITQGWLHALTPGPVELEKEIWFTDLRVILTIIVWRVYYKVGQIVEGVYMSDLTSPGLWKLRYDKTA